MPTLFCVAGQSSAPGPGEASGSGLPQSFLQSLLAGMAPEKDWRSPESGQPLDSKHIISLNPKTTLKLPYKKLSTVKLPILGLALP